MQIALGTVDRAIDVLLHLHEAGEPRGVTAIARALGAPKSNVHRIVGTLARRGLLERDSGGRYRPGVRLLALGLGVLEREPVVALARPVLEEEARVLGETVFLTAPRAGRMVVLDKAEGSGFLRAAPRIGDEIPLHATAVGRLALAFAPERVALPEGPLAGFTLRTPQGGAALEAAVALARQRGWDENHGEWVAGLSVVAVPVRVRGRLLAALAVAAPTERMRSLAGLPARRLRAAAARVEARAVGGPDTPDAPWGPAPPPEVRT